MNTTLALLGISGVGKSHLLEDLSREIPFQHLQASSLIQKGRATQQSQGIEQDALRSLSIDDNQFCLIQGFRASADPSSDLIVLDGHSLIDTPSGYVSISPAVFKEIGTSGIVFIADKPSDIFDRRLSDRSRNRPERSMRELEDYQTKALGAALSIALELGIYIRVLAADRRSELATILRSLTESV